MSVETQVKINDLVRITDKHRDIFSYLHPGCICVVTQDELNCQYINLGYIRVRLIQMTNTYILGASYCEEFVKKECVEKLY